MSRKTPTAQAPSLNRGKRPAVTDKTAPATPGDMLRKGVQILASLRLTVVLMFLSFWLVLFGTLAQVDLGIWTVMDKYFRSAIVWVPLQIFIPRTVEVAGGFPFPGGWLLGTLLLANLVAAHATRFKRDLKRSGIWFIHTGIILLMLGDLVTGLFAVESRMVIEEGKSTNFVGDHRHSELAFVDSSNPQKDQHFVVSESRLRESGKISDPRLPVDIEVVKFMPNSDLLDENEVPRTFKNPATVGIGKPRQSEIEPQAKVAVERPEGSGVDQEQTADIPSAYVKLLERKTSRPIGTYVVSNLLDPQLVEIDGKVYGLSLRPQRTYLPYKLHLTKFTHDVYQGTDRPKDFRSHVQLTDPEKESRREVEISMNAPLRYRGRTFYQASFMEPKKHGVTGTILQVVDNPGWLMPYVSCSLVVIGMLIHFGIKLMQFLNRSVLVKGAIS